MKYEQSLRVTLPDELDLSGTSPFFSDTGIRKLLLLSDLATALQAATDGVMVPEPQHVRWYLSPGNHRSEIGNAALVRPPHAYGLSAEQAARAYDGLHAFLEKFATVASSVSGLEPELRMAEQLEQRLKERAAARRIAGDRLWYGSRSIPSENQSGDEKAIVDDAAFEKYVSLAGLGRALDEVDAPTLTDLAIQMARGEQVLLRRHASGVTADRLFAIALDASRATGDATSLKRLIHAGKTFQRDHWISQAEAVEHLSSASRSTSTEYILQRLDLSPAGAARHSVYLHTIWQAAIFKDQQLLDGIDRRQARDSLLNSEQKARLHTLIESVRDVLNDPSEEDLALRRVSRHGLEFYNDR